MRGERGGAVAELQASLHRHGAAIVVDGIFGPATEAALSAFQRQAGLPATGTGDRATLAALG